MASGEVDLLQLFQAAAGALQQNQSALNKADAYNHDHGTNMVNTFDTIVQALQQKQGAKPDAQLKYVSQQLQQNATSGSGKMYAENFAKAANDFKGSGINLNNVLQLILMILGGGRSSTASGNSTDIIGSILGGLLGGQGGTSGQTGQGGGLGDILGTILGSQGSSSAQSSQGGNLGGLLGGLLGGQGGPTGSASSGSSGDLLGSLIGGLVGNSGMSDSTHHTQSGEIVTSSILGALAKLLNQ